jgi:hypothetical protein
MKKYKTWEITKALTENPNHEFKRVSDGMIFRTSKQIENGKEVARYISQITSPKGWADCVTLSDEWELIQQPIPFMEAVKACSEGKTIYCTTKDGSSFTYAHRGGLYGSLEERDGSGLSANEILNGVWYVEDSNE